MARIELYSSIGMTVLDTTDYIYMMCGSCMVGFVLHKKHEGKKVECSNCSDTLAYYIQNVCLFCTNKAELIPDNITGRYPEPYCNFHEMDIEDVFKQTRYEEIDSDEPTLMQRFLRQEPKVYRERVTRDVSKNGCVGLDTTLDHGQNKGENNE